LRLYNANFSAYKTTLRSSDRTVIYKLVNDTLTTTKAISTTLEDARNLLDALGQDNNVFQSIIDGFKTQIDGNITTVNQLLASLQTVKDTIDTSIQNSPLDIKNAAAAIMSAQENLTAKKESLAKLQAGADVNDIASAQSKVTNQQLALDKLMAGADPLDIQTQQLAVKDRQNALNDARETLADYNVTVPFDSVIAKVNVVQGDVASSGTSLATVISKQLLADVSLNEVDVAKIKIGNKATLTFDAIDGLSITGEVAEIDTVGTVTQGVVTYNVKIALDTTDDRIKPGMSVSASIIDQVKQDVLMLPNAAIKVQGGVNYVETLPANILPQPSADGGGNSAGTVSTKVAPTQVPIEIGIANDTMTEISAGELKEGDQVILKTVTTTSTTSAAAGGASGLRLGGGGFGGALGR
jgi:HlyD family secretion protein